MAKVDDYRLPHHTYHTRTRTHTHMHTHTHIGLCILLHHCHGYSNIKKTLHVVYKHAQIQTQNTLQTSQTGRQPPPLGPRYHSDKTHAVRGWHRCIAISARRAGKSLKVDFHGQQWDNRGSDGRRVHHIHGDVDDIGGLLKQPLAITEVTAHRRGLHHTRTDVQAQHDR